MPNLRVFPDFTGGKGVQGRQSLHFQHLVTHIGFVGNIVIGVNDTVCHGKFQFKNHTVIFIPRRALYAADTNFVALAHGTALQNHLVF